MSGDDAKNPEDVAAGHFHTEMLEGCYRLKALGYWPGYFHREVANEGGVATVRKLLDKDGTSDGFTTLWEMRRLDLSAEAFALLPWYRILFSDAQLDRAREQLERHGFDVDALLRRGLTTAPSWWRDNVELDEP